MLVGALSFALFWQVCGSLWPLEYVVFYGVMVALGAIIASSMAFGGLFKVFSTWKNANFHGYYAVTRMSSPSGMESHYINCTNYHNTVMPGWALYVPLGGWLTRPFLAHNGTPTQNFTVTSVQRDYMGFVAHITVRDRAGNRLTQHPSWFLTRLARMVPTDAKESDWANGFVSLIVFGERIAEDALTEMTRDRDALKGHWEVLVQAVSTSCIGIRTIIDRIESGDRLKSTREWKSARKDLEALCQTPTGTLNAMAGVGTTEEFKLIRMEDNA
jgi:hypothetical protein